MSSQQTASPVLADLRTALLPKTFGPQDSALERFGPRDEVDGLPILWKPSKGPQTLFLQSTARECLIGGAVLGGKTEALVMGALRWVYNPQYAAIILRRERDDLRESIDRGREMYSKICPGVDWVESRKRFEFPSGAFILFGEATYEESIEQYKTFQFSYIGFDELTTFTRHQYIYMLSRNRATKTANLPLQMRAGTNPDGPGHEWVFKRFVEKRDPFKMYSYRFEVQTPREGLKEVEMTRQFIPATVFDNPHIADLDEYLAGLRSMGKQLSDALLYGRWDYFQGQMFPYAFEEVEPGFKESSYYIVRCMDYGWTDPSVIYWLAAYPQEEGLPRVEVIGEMYVKETNTRGLAHLIKYKEDQIRRTYNMRPVTMSVIDPSASKSEGTSGGQNIKDQIQAAGVWFEKADNDRQSGWASIRQLLENGLLKFWKNSCPYLLSTMPTLVRDPAKADDIRPKQNDHGADTLRYGCMAITNLGNMGSIQTSQETSQQMVQRGQDPFYPEIVKRLKGGAGENFENEFLGKGW